MTTAQSNRIARAAALVAELTRTAGVTPRAARLADKIFGRTRGGFPCWNDASLFYRAALISGQWAALRA